MTSLEPLLDKALLYIWKLLHLTGILNQHLLSTTTKSGQVDIFGKLGSNDKFPLLSYKWHQVICNLCIEAALSNEFIFQKEINSKYMYFQQRNRLASHRNTSGKQRLHTPYAG